MKLVMLPSAGGNSMMYQDIEACLVDSFEVYNLDYSGHGRRIRLPLLMSINEIVDDLIIEMEKLDIFDGEPYALFGYSMGSIVSYEMVNRLIERNLAIPKYLFLCASSVENIEQVEHIESIPETELYTYLEELGGTSKELLDNEDFQSYFYPIIEADLIAIGRYQAEAAFKIPIPAMIMYGSQDKYPKEAVQKWVNYIEACTFEEIEGGHFFLYHAEKQISELIKGMCRFRK